MKDATCRSSTRSLQKAKRIYHGPKIGATNLEAGPPILVWWPHCHKTQTGATQYGQQVCYCRRKVTAAHIRDTLRVHAGEACFTSYLRLRFGALGPPRL